MNSNSWIDQYHQYNLYGELPIKNDCWSQKDCHSKIFPLNFLITSSGSLTLTGF